MTQTRRPNRLMPMIRLGFRTVAFTVMAGSLLAGACTASAWAQQDGRDGFLGGLFNRNERERGGYQQQGGGYPAQGQASEADLIVRLDRLENALRQLTGTVEQLQYRNQQLEQ